jgi:PST family polysaccharide transporter
MRGVGEQLKGLLRHGLFQNASFLYGMQFASYLFSLLTVPYLTRVLGPTAWGLVAFALAFGGFVGLVVEYGFIFSATREVSLHRNTRDRLAELLAGVLGAKVLLALPAVGVAFLVRPWMPPFQEQPALFYAGIFLALAQSFSLTWYYQGLERMRTVVALDMSAKALATAGIFLLVRSPEDGWKVLALQGLAFLLSTAAGLYLAYREVSLRFPSPILAWKVLRTGWSMFVFKSSSSLYVGGNALVLGLLAPPQFVGYFVGAEKIVNAFFSLLEPVSQTLYPRLSHLVHHARAEADRLVRFAILFMSVSGLLMGILIFLLAPLLVRVLLGDDFGPAVPVLQVMALIPALGGLSYALHIQWMLPLRWDRLFATLIMGTGLLNIALALVLAPRYFALGMAWSLVASELFLTVATIYVWLRWQGSTPEQR